MSGALRIWQWVASALFRERIDVESTGQQPGHRDDAWWRDVVSISNAGLVTPVLWERIRHSDSLTVGLSVDMRAYLDAMHELYESRNAAILEQFEAAAGLLATHDIEVLPIKGAAYLLQGLGEARLRHLSDIDLLVPARQADRSREILLGAGYQEVPVTLEGGHRHLTPLINPAFVAAIELHTDILPGYLSQALSVDEVWSRARIVADGGRRARVPHPTDCAAISFLHAELVDRGTELWLIPLREFLDLAMLRQSFGTEIDWSEIAERAARVSGRTRFRRYAYVYEQLSGNRLLPELKYSLFDALGYKISLAAIDRPRILKWRMRVHRLSARRLQRKYAIDGCSFAMSMARTREAGRILSGLFRPRNKKR